MRAAVLGLGIGLLLLLAGPAFSADELVAFIDVAGAPGDGEEALASALLAHRYLRKHPSESDQPLLNNRAAQLIGQNFDLIDPIVNGRGSIHSGDTIWRVEGPELPKGTRIKVVGADGALLKVEPDIA